MKVKKFEFKRFPNNESKLVNKNACKKGCYLLFYIWEDKLDVNLIAYAWMFETKTKRMNVKKDVCTDGSGKPFESLDKYCFFRAGFPG